MSFQLQIQHKSEDTVKLNITQNSRVGFERDFLNLASARLITCVVDGVPHLVTVDESGLVGIVVLEDSLKEKTNFRSKVGKQLKRAIQDSML